MKTKEYNEAVEKISNAIGNIDKLLSLEEIIAFTIDALGVEIVSKASNDPSDKTVGFEKNQKIISRNSKPAVYVENIGK